MPIVYSIFVSLIILIVLVFRNSDMKLRRKKVVQLVICTITWCTLIHQLIRIAHYIDDSGEMIKNVLGNYGLGLLWFGIGLFSIYLVYLYIDYFVFKNDK